MREPENADAKQAGRFRKGQSGNPAGKPKGARHKTTIAMEALLDGEAEKLTRMAIDTALAGDTVALRLCLDRILPPRKDRPISFALPKIETTADAVKAVAAILRAVADGEVTPAEGGEAARLIETFLKTVETADLDERLRRLEDRFRA